LDGAREACARGSESEAEVRRLLKAIAWNHEDAPPRETAAKVARVGATSEPWERGHAARGTDPVQQAGVSSEDLVQKREILLRYLTRARIDLAAVLQGQHRQ